jgi:hypothetical protein
MTTARAEFSKRFPYVTALALLISCITAADLRAADPVAELASFSVFDKIDIAQLAKGDARTARGPAMNSPRYLSVQSCYVVPVPPPKLVDAMRNWDPTKHSQLGVVIHGDISGAPNAATFARLRNAPENGVVRSLVTATAKASPDLQISRDEEKKLTGASSGGLAGAAGFWSDLLAARAQAFASGGSSAQPPYDHTGQNVRPGEELGGLLRQQEKIRKQFSGLLDSSGIGRGGGSMKPEMYWELLEVEDQGVVALGASYTRPGANGTYQGADAMYYASGGFYVSLSLYQMWPVDVDGKPSTLVWRGDLVSAASLGTLHGVERLGSESAMMKDIGKAVNLFRRDVAR